MRHGFTRITGLTLAILSIASAPGWAGGYKHRPASGEAQGMPPVGGALNTDTSVDGQVEPNLKQPDAPSASPRTETEPGARDHAPHPVRPAPRSDDTLTRPDARSPRSPGSPELPSPRRDASPRPGEAQSPRPERAPGQPEQPLGAYKQ
jgi:hypothetical protein